MIHYTVYTIHMYNVRAYMLRNLMNIRWSIKVIHCTLPWCMMCLFFQHMYRRTKTVDQWTIISISHFTYFLPKIDSYNWSLDNWSFTVFSKCCVFFTNVFLVHILFNSILFLTSPISVVLPVLLQNYFVQHLDLFLSASVSLSSLPRHAFSNFPNSP